MIYRQTSSTLISTIDYYGNYCDKTVHIIVNKENGNVKIEYLLTIFKSKLLNYFYKLSTEELGRAFAQVKTLNIKKLPFILSKKQQPFIEKANLILSLNKELKEFMFKFNKFLSDKYQLDNLFIKQEKLYEISFPDFIKELNKAIKAAKGTPLTKKDEFEWMELFEENKKKALELKAEIDKTDKEIDQMVYELYGLTEEEIGIVENS